MKLRIKDRRMKERVVGLSSLLDGDESILSELFAKAEVLEVKIEPIYGGIFYEV